MRNYVSNQQHAWVKWLHLREYCYNTSHHMSISMPPFHDIYHYDALSFVDLVLSDRKVPIENDFIKQSQNIIRSLKDNLQYAQNQ